MAIDMLQMIAELRGGVPEKCDFCGEPFTKENYSTPEEAGDWACISCVRRWMAEAKANGVTQTGKPLPENDDATE